MSEQERTAGRNILKDRYNAKISQSQQRAYRASMDYEYSYSIDGTVSAHRARTITCVDITMDQEHFDYFCQTLGWLHGNNNRDMVRYDNEVLLRLQHEKQLRKDHPALQIAYDKYRLMLDMVANGKDIEE